MKEIPTDKYFLEKATLTPLNVVCTYSARNVTVKSGAGDDAVCEKTNELITVHKIAWNILRNTGFKRILA